MKRDSGGPNFEGMQQNYPPFEDHSFDRFKKDTLSHPPTPVTPGASSTHDEYDVASSPSCPGTPVSTTCFTNWRNRYDIFCSQKVDNRDVSHVMGSMSVVPGLPNTTSTPSKLSNEVGWITPLHRQYELIQYCFRAKCFHACASWATNRIGGHF